MGLSSHADKGHYFALVFGADMSAVYINPLLSISINFCILLFHIVYRAGIGQRYGI